MVVSVMQRAQLSWAMWTVLWAAAVTLSSRTWMAPGMAQELPKLRTQHAASYCPGLANGVCQKECQLHLCGALAQFYKVSNNVSDPWDNEHGWELTAKLPCERLVASASAGRAVYCDWFGITCCSPSMLADGNCTAVNVITGLDMPINNLNVSLADPVFLNSVQKLHACGLTVLAIEANNLVDNIVDEWGTLVNLKVFSIGNAWVAGPIPNALRQLRNLTLINLSNNFINGTLPDWLHELEQLETLMLGSMFGHNDGTDMFGLMGTIPRELGRLKNLRQLNLESNSLTGTLPPLCHGDDSSLIMLSVRANLLSGSVEVVEQCGNLVLLDISRNGFSGTLPASKDWDELATYRACCNNFTGLFPVLLCKSSRMLQYVDVSFNQLSGNLPNHITLLNNLKMLNMASNNLSDWLTFNIFYLPSLATINLSNNGFKGVLTDAIGLSVSLQDLDFSNNPGITGMIPPQLGLLSTIEKFKVTNTSMSCAGIIRPFSVLTSASCGELERCTEPTFYGDNQTQHHICTESELLPCFLRFSDYQIPRDDDSNMRCRYILRKEQQQAIEDCSGDSAYDLRDQASMLPNASEAGATWLVDPLYYQYRECSCLVGYSETWTNNGTRLICVEQPAGSRTTTIVVACVASVAGAAILFALLLVWLLYLRTKPRWLRERIMQGKRTCGAPKCTKPGDKVTVSIVVTDVKDFSELTRHYPELMSKAMGGHNNILRKACHAHAGYVLDQEGDSWAIAFHDAEDACAFSLQVQQALMHKVWGMRMPNTDQTLDLLRNVNSLRHEGFSTKGNTLSGSGTSAGGGGGPDQDMDAGIDPRADSGAAAGASGAAVQHPHQQGSEASIRAGRVGVSGASFTSSTGHPHSCSASSQSEQVQHSAHSGHSGHATSLSGSLSRFLNRQGSKSSKSSAERLHMVQLSFTDTHQLRDGITPQRLAELESASSWGGAPAGMSGTGVSRSSFGSSAAPERAYPSIVGSIIGKQSSGYDGGSGSTKTWGASGFIRKFSQMTGKSSQVSNTFNGLGDPQCPLKVLRLAVRIGIATGPLPHNCEVANCAVKDKAKELVSEVANAGQVLMDEPTFRLVKDCLNMLGMITESGYDDTALQSMLQSRVVNGIQSQVGCSACRSPSLGNLSFTSTYDTNTQDYDNDAVVVHMGCFEVPNVPVDDPSKQQASSGSDSDTNKNQDKLELVIPGGRTRNRTPNKHVRQKLHLYSIAAPGMRRRPESTQELTRVLGWADTITPKPGWVLVQKGYFDAPGARQMDLTPSSQMFGHSHAPLPDVTMIFVSVVGASAFTSKRPRQETHMVNKAIIKCLLQQLRSLPGGDGYLCRCQEADLKYMVAFEQPHKAVQWCLLVQEAMMYVDWPDYVLSHPGFEEVLDSASGLPMFRGPRLRMGLAEGQPNSVLPDHEGRANYYGSSVNKAARFMDAAAHGGQVVTNLELIRKLFQDWVAQDREGPPLSSTPSLTAAEKEQVLPTAADAGLGNGLHQLPKGQLQRSASSPKTSFAVSNPPGPAIAEGGILPRRARLQQQQQRLSAEHLHSNPMLQLASRSRSETAARVGFADQHVWSRHGLHLTLHRHNEEGGSSAAVDADDEQDTLTLPPRSRSYTAATRLSRSDAEGVSRHQTSPFGLLQPRLRQHGVGGIPQPLPTPTTRDAVSALHLGTFTFKGIGECEMVQVLHAALASRVYPAEPPKGKGERVRSANTGPVQDLPQVQLQVPTALIAARQAFAAVSFSAGGY